MNSELKKLDINDKVLYRFTEEFQLEPAELSLITSNVDVNFSINDNFFDVLQKIQNIHEKAKTSLANNQHITG